MIQEEYVSFETAKLLKEKGFDEKSVKVWYDESGEMYYDRREIKYQVKIENHEKFFQCPTQAITMKWLREVHNAIVNVFYDKDEEKWCAEHYRMLKDDYTLIGYHDTYEEAAESAIKYCLENLI